MVERVGGGDGADEDEHDEAHALLPVVGAVREADAGAGKQQQGANGPRRRLVVLGRLVEGGVLDEPLGDQHEQRRRAKTDQRRDQQHLENLGGLFPIHSGGAGADVEQLVGEAHADDGADHGVRAGGGQPEPPGAQVPYDGGNQQGEDHGVARAGADLENQLDGQQGNDGEGHGAGGEEHTGQVAEPGPDHGDVRLQRVGVDDRGDGVGGVVKAVDELEAESDEQRQTQQKIGPDAGDRHRVQILGDMEADVGKAAQQGEEEKQNAGAA